MKWAIYHGEFRKGYSEEKKYLKLQFKFLKFLLLLLLEGLELLVILRDIFAVKVLIER